MYHSYIFFCTMLVPARRPIGDPKSSLVAVCGVMLCKVVADVRSELSEEVAGLGGGLSE